MDIQVLVATIDQKDHGILKKMNIQSDAIIANQCDVNDVEDLDYKGCRVRYLSFAERGVGLNRNNALMRATAEIFLLADDDMVLCEGYPEKIKKIFSENPKADVIIFNLTRERRMKYKIKRKRKIGYKNFMRYGAAGIAAKTRSITKRGITFNLHFGGGADYSSGEDTLFLLDCLRKNLNIVAVPECIAELTNTRKSTWFEGYNDKYFIDKGILFATMSRRWAWLLSLQFCIRHRRMFRTSKKVCAAYILMLRGIKEVKNS